MMSVIGEKKSYFNSFIVVLMAKMKLIINSIKVSDQHISVNFQAIRPEGEYSF